MKCGFTPQGICKCEKGYTFISCYKKGKPSRIYVYSSDNKLVKYVNIKCANKLMEGHFGGIEVILNNFYISTDGYLLVCDLNDVLNFNKVVVKDKIKTNNGADFCFRYDDIIFAGEFYKSGKFETSIHHKLLLNGEKFSAVCFGFKNGLTSNALAVPDIVQGIAVYNDLIFVSRSYGLSKSLIEVYNNVFKKRTKFTFFDNDKKIPLYYLSKIDLVKTYEMTFMSEEIAIFDNKLLILFENASKKYKLFTRTKIKNVIEVDIDKIKRQS